ncbi:2-succinylbenzoate--CoA ligase [compost metagenome]
MTETSGIASARPTSAPRAEQSAGRPVPLARLRLGTTDYRPGAQGEVFIAGPHVFQGYLTADGVVGLPEDGWFPSGDLGRVTADGELRIVGRAKDVIIRSGHNIDPQLIEDTALAHPDIAQAVAVGMPDAYAGEVPVLFAMLRPGAVADADAIARFVGQRIAEPPARPRQVFLLAELPLTPFAKVARFRLRQLAVEHCARLAVAGLAEDLEVRCDDPAARRVTLGAPRPVSAAQRQAILQALARLDLEVQPMT